MNFYKKSLIIALLIASIPASIIGIFIYFFGNAKVEEEVRYYHEAQLKQSARRLDDYLFHLEQTTTQWAYNSAFDEYMRTADLGDRYSETLNMYKSLTALKSSNVLIDQAYLYLDYQNALVSDDRGVMKIEDNAQKRLYRELLSQGPGIRWVSLPQSPQTPATSIPVQLVMKLSGTGGGQPYGLLLMYVNRVKFNDLISEFQPGSGATLLYGEQRDVITTGRSDLDLTALEKAFMDRMSEFDKLHRSDIWTFERQKYSSSAVTLPRSGTAWTLLTLTPLSKLAAPVNLLSRMILIGSAIGLTVAVLLSLIASRQLYRPISQLLGLVRQSGADPKYRKDEFEFLAGHWQNLSRESQVLQTRLDHELPNLRQSFLLQLVQGQLPLLKEADLRQRMSQLGWNDDNGIYTVIIVKLLGFSKLQGRFSEGDEPLVTFAAANIAGELAQAHFAGSDLLNLQDMTVGLIVASPESSPPEERKRSVMRLCNDLVEALERILKVEVAICLGRSTVELHRLPDIWDEAKRTLRYRDVNESNQILDMNEMLPQGQDEIKYPFALEKDMIHALRSGLENEACTLADQFLEQLRLSVSTELYMQQCILQLLGNLLNAMQQAGVHTGRIVAFQNPYEELLRFHEPEEMMTWIKRHLVQPMVRHMIEQQDEQLKHLVEQVLQTIHDEYAKDISLEYCADLHGSYPQKVSIAFKRITGFNFIDYVTNLRIEKAKELLLTTNHKVNDIAEMVGYQSSYFNRIFKRHAGVTPGQYREQFT